MLTCARCKKEIFCDPQSLATGYGLTTQGDKHCYACCGEIDLEDMRATGRATLYLSKGADGWRVGNWPGTLTRPVYGDARIHGSATVPGPRMSRHNFAGNNGRRDFWFTVDGDTWHGVNIGDSQIAHCRRVQERG